MLSLSRRENEALIIGDDIKMIILKIERGRVSIGIEAPSGVLIMREEVLDRINQQKIYANENK